MAKPPRSPLVGYNHNLTHRGRVFHVQTEDSGPLAPRLFTHLFYEGTILVSRKHEYDGALPEDQVRQLMQLQHKTVMKDLLRSRLDGVILPFFAARGDDLSAVAAASSVDGQAVAVLPGPTVATFESDPEVPAPPAAPGPRRTATRPLGTTSSRGAGAAPPIVVRVPEGRRSPFVSSGAPTAARTASTDGVVIQRNLVVGGSGVTQSSRRIRPPVPYVVTGGGHGERPSRGAGASSMQQTPSVPSTPQPVSPSSSASTSGLIAASGAEGPGRSNRPFGGELPDDKSLDEVILEYLSEDADPS